MAASIGVEGTAAERILAEASRQATRKAASFRQRLKRSEDCDVGTGTFKVDTFMCRVVPAWLHSERALCAFKRVLGVQVVERSLFCGVELLSARH